ncbi:MAG: hypothetical protein NC320_11555 [Clostridium sp.]|nr:hypothetical protein [Clostridium sp.]
MLEKETASVIKFVTDATGGATPYYHNMPENFAVPSVYFPSPEIIGGNDTFSTYSAEYTMFINFFHSSTELAYELALPVLNKIEAVRRIIPIFEETGKATGKYVRIKNVELKKADECVYQMQVDWICRRPCDREDSRLVQNFYLNGGRL